MAWDYCTHGDMDSGTGGAKESKEDQTHVRTSMSKSSEIRTPPILHLFVDLPLLT
jgi:hypothetical protein